MDSSQEPKSSFSPSTDSSHAPEGLSDSPAKENMFLEVLKFAALALVIVLPIRFFIAQPFIVSGASMETTFSTGQYLIVDQLTYHLEEPKRGDVVIFRYPKDPSKFFIKRIIGVPGDTVEISGRDVTIKNESHPDGIKLDELYVHAMRPNTPITETLGDYEYFVMGDNRDQSSDSRAWGVLQRDKIVGRAFLRLFPLTDVGVLPGAYDLESKVE